MALSMAAALLAFFLEADTVVRGGCAIDRRQKKNSSSLSCLQRCLHRTGVVFGHDVSKRKRTDEEPTFHVASDVISESDAIPYFLFSC